MLSILIWLQSHANVVGRGVLTQNSRKSVKRTFSNTRRQL